MSESVFITGIGAFTSYGKGTGILWQNLLAGNRVITTVPSDWKLSENEIGYYAPLPIIDYKSEGFVRQELSQYDPMSLHGLIALREALQNADLPVIQHPNDRLGRMEIVYENRISLYAGTGIGGLHSLLNATFGVYRTKSGIPERLDPLTIAKSMPNNLPAACAIKYGLHQSIHCGQYACATGTLLIGEAFKAIQRKETDIAIVVTSELADNQGLYYQGFVKAKTLTNCPDIQSANRPFDKERDGFLFSEGAAAALIIESETSLLQRKAKALTQILGFSESFDAYNMLSPDPNGTYIKSMIKRLLEESQISASKIGYINAHGTGTVKNDQIEADLYGQLFPHAPVINSTKSYLGHTIASAGALEAIICTLSLNKQKTHANANLVHPISTFLNLPKSTVNLQTKLALSLSSAFGGHNGALLFKKV